MCLNRSKIYDRQAKKCFITLWVYVRIIDYSVCLKTYLANKKLIRCNVTLYMYVHTLLKHVRMPKANKMHHHNSVVHICKRLPLRYVSWRNTPLWDTWRRYRRYIRWRGKTPGHRNPSCPWCNLCAKNVHIIQMLIMSLNLPVERILLASLLCMKSMSRESNVCLEYG